MKRIFSAIICVVCMALPLSAYALEETKQPENLALYRQVMQNETSFISVPGGTARCLAQLNEADFDFTFLRFALADVDRDGRDEVVIALAMGQDEYYGYLVLDERSGAVYGYEVWYRAMLELKADGSFSFSSGFADNGFGYFELGDEARQIICMTYSESAGEDGVRYYHDGKPITREQYEQLQNQQDEKDAVVWHAFTDENIESLLRGEKP